MKRTAKPVRAFVRNTATLDLVENQFQLLAVNKRKSAPVRNARMEDRDYLVVPMVMMVEGVLNGSHGALYYPASELSKVPCIWNHKPVVVYHPTSNGVGVSACDADVISNRKVGVIMNAHFSKGALKAEAWLEPDRLKKVDARILENLEAGIMTEISTGLFTDNEAQDGEFNGKPYTGIARNYKPDHLAILPDQTGACSIQDGAGLLRNAQSYDMIRQKLHALLNPAASSSKEVPSSYKYIRDVFDGYFIYEDGVKLFKREYTNKDEVVALAGKTVEVLEVKDYKTKDAALLGNGTFTAPEPVKPVKPIKKISKGNSTGNPKTNKESTMNKAQMIVALIANGIFEEGDAEFLESKSDEQVARLHTNAFPPAKKKDEEEMTDEEKAAMAKKMQKNSAAPAPVTAEEYIANAPDGIRDMLQVGLISHNAEKSRLIGEITANKANTFSKETLGSLALNQLQGIAALAKSAAPATPVANFAGQGAVSTPAPTANTEEPLVAMTMDFSKK